MAQIRPHYGRDPFFGDFIVGQWVHPEIEPVLYPKEIRDMYEAGEIVWAGEGWYWPKHDVTLKYDEAA